MLSENAKRILIIDKNPAGRNKLASRFRHQGYDVETSNSGFQVLSLLEREYISTLIITGESQDMGNEELVALSRAILPKEDLQIILSDKRAKESDLSTLFNLGISEVIIYNEKNFGEILKFTSDYISKRKNRNSRSFLARES